MLSCGNRSIEGERARFQASCAAVDTDDNALANHRHGTIFFIRASFQRPIHASIRKDTAHGRAVSLSIVTLSGEGFDESDEEGGGEITYVIGDGFLILGIFAKREYVPLPNRNCT
jgi:hypothetical protein